MRTLFFCTLLAITSAYSAWSQDVAVMSYGPYYEAVNRAELCISEFKYAEALHVYDSIFLVFPKHKVRDLYNASLCAIHCKQPHKAQRWIMEQIVQGISIKTLNANILKQQPSEFWRAIEQSYDSLQFVAHKAFDVWRRFKSEIDEMNSKEQAAATDDTLDRNAYYSLLYTHTQRLYQLIDSFGVPPVPVFGSGQHLPASMMVRHFDLRHRFKNGEFDTLMPPFCNMDLHQYDIEAQLIDAIRSGNIDPYVVYSYVSPIDASSFFGNRALYQVNIDLKTRTVNLEKNKNMNIAAENMHRKRFYLPPEEDALKKDVMIVLYYNQDLYPFEEHIRADSLINYSKAIYDQLPTNEQHRLLLKYMEVHDNVKAEHFERLRKRIHPSGEQRNYFYDMLSLKDFKLPGGGYVVSEKPLL